MFSYHPEEVLYDNTGEPSPYELEMERLRMDKLLQSQVRKYGDDATRTQPTIALARGKCQAVSGSHCIASRPGKDTPGLAAQPGREAVSQTQAR